METPLTEQQVLLRDSAARLCRARGGMARSRVLQQTGQEIDRDAWHAMCDGGWPGIVLDVAHGGLGLGATELGLLSQEIGREDVRVPLAPVAVAARAVAGGCGAPLDRILAGNSIIVPATCGAGTAFSAAGTLPRAENGADGWALHGIHLAVPGAAMADHLLVAAAAPDGTKMLCLLHPDDAGVTLRRHALIDGSSVADVILDHARVPDARLAGPAGTSIGEIDVLLSIAVSFELLGLGEALFALTLDHLKLRTQFGRPIGSFQALQHRAVDGFVALELLSALAFRVAAGFDAGTMHPALVPALKAKAGRSVLAIARFAMQMHGAMGYAAEHDVGLRYKRALALSARHGNEAAQTACFAALADDAA